MKSSAQEFLDWVAQPEHAQAYADLSGAVPITGIDAGTLLPAYAPIGELLSTAPTPASRTPRGPTRPCTTRSGAGVQGLLTGQKTVDQVLEEMDAAWDQ